MLKELEQRIDQLQSQLEQIQPKTEVEKLEYKQLYRDLQELKKAYHPRTAADKVYLARHPMRPNINDYIDALFTDFFECKGDRLCKDDGSIVGGVAIFHGMAVTVIGHKKGRTLQENLACNFGMPGPEGYRKALRLMKQAEKFGRPIITFIDTPGAYPGKEAEEHGQAEAIARNLAEMSTLAVPIISIVTGEGSSGGALALGVADTVLMLEHSIYAVLSPEGFASILWKDSSRWDDAAQQMKLTAQDLMQLGLIDGIIPEPFGGAHNHPEVLFETVDTELYTQLKKLCKIRPAALTASRYQKFRNMGNLMQEESL